MPRNRSRARRAAPLPRAVVPLAALAVVFLVVPVIVLAVRVDWSSFGRLITTASSLAALSLSLRTGVLSTLVCIVLGIPLALLLARTRFPGQRVLRALVLLPLVLPPVVSGLALLYTFSRFGTIGGFLASVGISVAFSTTAVVIAQAFVAMPFLVLSVEGTLRSAGTGYEEVAATLGSRPTRTFLRVTLPLLAPAVISGALLAFARSLGEFGATLTFAGSLQGVTRTLPLEIYLQRQDDPDAAVALSLVLVAVAIVIVTVVHSTGGTSGFRKGLR